MRRPDGEIDLSSPVEWGHPLNAGRVAWWLGVPGWAGGGTLPDLCRRADATLSNTTWGGNTRPGAVGPLLSPVVAAGSPAGQASCAAAALDLTGPLTLALWYRMDAAAATSKQYFLAGKSQGTSPFGGYWLRTNGSTQIQAGAGIGGSFKSANASLTGPFAGVWRHVALVYDGSLLTCLVDGNPGTPVAATGAVTVVADAFRFLGGAAGPIGSNLLGQTDDLSVWGRALGVGEIRSVVAESLRGNPDTLRRLSRRAWLFGTGGGPPPPPPGVTDYVAGFQAAGLTDYVASF